MSENDNIGANWPQYRSHKVVRAAQIISVGMLGDRNVSVLVADGPKNATVHLGPEMVARYMPKRGDFLVRYEPDGYLSVSPRDKFLDGYTLLFDGVPVIDAARASDEPPGRWSESPVFDRDVEAAEAPIDTSLFDFGRALYWLRQGRKVARQGWNGKGMWIALTPGSIIPSEMARSGAAAHLADANPGVPITILPHIDMKAADGSIVIGWLASQTDMLAHDWTVVQ